MVRIRLQRLGRRNRSCYRIVVSDVRVKRQGDYLENLGSYDPVQESVEKKLTVKADRVAFWVKQGAQPTKPVIDLLKLKGINWKNADKAVVAAAPAALAAPAAEAPKA